MAHIDYNEATQMLVFWPKGAVLFERSDLIDCGWDGIRLPRTDVCPAVAYDAIAFVMWSSRTNISQDQLERLPVMIQWCKDWGLTPPKQSWEQFELDLHALPPTPPDVCTYIELQVKAYKLTYEELLDQAKNNMYRCHNMIPYMFTMLKTQGRLKENEQKQLLWSDNHCEQTVFDAHEHIRQLSKG